jgi:amino acid transporter
MSLVRLLVGIFNPTISIVSMMSLSMEEIYAHPSEMLAVMADKIAGPSFRTFICIDAIIVLCGGVMTAIVGVSGLLTRLAKDKVLPEVLSHTNCQNASYVAIITFVITAITLFLAIFDPEDPTGINNFGGVFAISFVSVLIAFAYGAITLKLYRPRLARLAISSWWQIVVSLISVTVGFIGKLVFSFDY